MCPTTTPELSFPEGSRCDVIDVDNTKRPAHPSSKLSAEKHRTLERAVGDAQKMIAEKQPGEAVNGWQIARGMMGN